MDLWDKFCVSKLKTKQLTGNTLKVYLRNMEFFLKFISKGLLYKNEMLDKEHKKIILRLSERLPDYHGQKSRTTWRPTMRALAFQGL